MELFTLGILLTMVIMIIIFSIICVFEYYLAKKKNNLIGLIIPILLFLISIILCVSLFRNIKEGYIITANDKQKYTYQNEAEAKQKFDELSSLNEQPEMEYHVPQPGQLKDVISNFAFVNLGTIILLVIYFKTKKNNNKCNKMYINDL